MGSRQPDSHAELRATHTPEAVRKRLSTRIRSSYLSDLIYGAIDGAVTTFAVVSGVEGARLPATIVIILGAANLLGDGFSMAAGNFLGTRAESQRRDRARRREMREVEMHPEGEREELRQIFAGKGFSGEVLEEVVRVISSNKDRWIDTMMSEELGMPSTARSAWRAAASTLVAFIVIGAIPLIPFLPLGSGTLLPTPFLGSAMMTGVAFFAIGALKSRFVDQRWWIAGAETLGIGGIAAAIAYGVGVMLRGLAG